jgi:hypothetical protein
LIRRSNWYRCKTDDILDYRERRIDLAQRSVEIRAHRSTSVLLLPIQPRLESNWSKRYIQERERAQATGKTLEASGPDMASGMSIYIRPNAPIEGKLHTVKKKKREGTATAESEQSNEVQSILLQRREPTLYHRKADASPWISTGRR